MHHGPRWTSPMRDVIVIGGGPAGTTAATLLARKGLSVTLLERERFPRFQIGESLLPYNNDLFARLGVTDELLAGDYHPKYGAFFVTADGAISYRFLESWSVAFLGTCARLLNDAKDSPIVDDAGDANQFFGGALINYQF